MTADCNPKRAIMPEVSDAREVTTRDVLARYPALREDQLRYLEKWGLVQPTRTAAGRAYGFSDLAVIRQAAAALSGGRPLRAIVRQLEAERHGQLKLDFRLEAAPARVIALTPRQRPQADGSGSPSDSDISRAEALFLEAAALDVELDTEADRAESLYRQALEADPYLVAALINLGNLHYARNRLAEALALYEQAVWLAPDYFEAHYNRANVLHDAVRFDEAADAYGAALDLDPAHAEAHFYLAVTLEKLERSADARPHWEAYRRLAPGGAWAELAREFIDNA
jgi:tetratricopeptide (TPR) repeat protein